MRKGRILNPRLSPSGYSVAEFSKNNRKNSVGLHWLVIAAFRPTDNVKFIEHIDGDKTNDRLDNLKCHVREAEPNIVRETLLFTNNLEEQHPVSLVKDPEVWRAISGFENFYEVSNWGRIKSLSREVIGAGGCPHKIIPERILSFLGKNTEYYVTKLYKNGTYCSKAVHRFVMEAFKPEKCGNVINHIDGDKHNNYIHNLEWCTTAQNAEHSCKTGLSGWGERHPTAKLTYDQVTEMKRLSALGVKTKELSKMFNTTMGNVRHIVTGISWKKHTGEVRLFK
jgi:hypothetical protein